MPGLRDYSWEVGYSTSDVRADGRVVDLLHDFYIPVLERSTIYDRVAGYFSSSSLAVASRGFSRFVRQGGKARFIVGADVSEEDAEAILRGNLERVGRTLEARLTDAGHWPEEVRRGVELLAWMVAHEHLDVRIAIRMHAEDRRPRPMDYQGDGYVHEKWAIFEDGQDALIAAGSLNESRTGLVLNAENLEILPGWEARGQERLARKRQAFEDMWRDRHRHIRTFPLPEAVRQRILRIAERVRRLVEVDGTPAPEDATQVREPSLMASAQERARFALLRLAPLLPGGEYVGMETAPIEPWPHQRFVARRIIGSHPANHLLCDEVGLGKTIEAGLVFRALWLCGRARTIRVFAPASLTSQWLHEMAEKFLMPFRRRINRGGDYETVDPATGRQTTHHGEMFDYPLEIISTGLLIHDRSARLLGSMGETDLVLVDEAHKARRRDPDQQRREPRFNNLYRAIRDGMFGRTRSLLLATATPMQLNPVEAFDLLRFMPAAGAVRLSPDLCNEYYALRDRLFDGEPPEGFELRFLARYLGDARRTARPQWEFVAQHVVDLFARGELENLVDHGFPPADWSRLQPALSMLAPLGRPMLRHTRELLRCYQRDGLLTGNLAVRNVHPEIIPLEGEERRLYDALQEYAAELAARIGAAATDTRQQAAIGFYLSFLRLRFASSFQALALSLERRLEKIQRTLEHHASREVSLDPEADPEEFTEDELTGLVLRNRQPADLTWELNAVAGLRASLLGYTRTPRKTRALLELVERRRNAHSGRVRQMVVFTRYADTLEYLRDELYRRLPDCPIGTFSGSGGTVREPGAQGHRGLDRREVRRRFVDGAIDVLLCTDAAAEGLNLQSADLLVNFDLPWNPMLLEQRVGRIDRIGQQHGQIHVTNFLYQGSVEEVVYVRLVERFRKAASVAGELQFSLLPIEERDFQDYAKTPTEAGSIGWEELLRRAQDHQARIQVRQRLTAFGAEAQKQAYEAIEREAASRGSPLSLQDIWDVLSKSQALSAIGCRVEAFRHGAALAVAGIPGVPQGTLLTTSRALYEHGLPKGDDRQLRFATYGDAVFERLLDTVLATEARVLAAWRERQPLQAIEDAAGRRVGSLADVDARGSLSGEMFTPVPREADRAGDPERGRIGELHADLLRAAASSLAQRKLRDQPDGPNAQLSRLDSFIRDVERRQPPEFQIPVTVPGQSEYLARNLELLWRLESAGANVRLNGDPLLLRVCRALIERALLAADRERRTASGIAERLAPK